MKRWRLRRRCAVGVKSGILTLVLVCRVAIHLIRDRFLIDGEHTRARAYLVRNPRCRGMLRNIEPHNPSATVSQDDHDVEQSKRGRHGDQLSMAAMPIASLCRKLRHVGQGVPTRRTM